MIIQNLQPGRIIYIFLFKRYKELHNFQFIKVDKGRKAYDWSVETTVYVKQDSKRRGIGRLLYEFEPVGRFHKSGYKFDNWYDMIWMEKMIGEHSEKPKEVTFGNWEI